MMYTIDMANWIYQETCELLYNNKVSLFITDT